MTTTPTTESQTNETNLDASNEHHDVNDTTTIKDDTAVAADEIVVDHDDEDDEGVTKEHNNNTTDDTNDNDEDGDTATDSSESDFDPTSSSTNDSERQTIGDISYRRQCIVLYSEPVQRQRWDDEQVLPRVNWGDLFFDLFYVAATYNVSNIITTSPNRFGFLYSVGTYWPLQGIVHYRTAFDARFVVLKDNVYQRIFQIIHFLVLSVAVLAIRPVYIMATPSQYISMFMFSLALIIERCMAAMKYAEVYWFGIGQPTLKQVASREVFYILLAVPFYIAAAAVSGYEYFSNKYSYNSEVLNTAADHDSYTSGSKYSDTTNHTVTTTDHYTNSTTTNHTNTTTTSSSLVTTHGTEHLFFRDLAETSSSTEDSSYPFNHIPIYLCLAGYVLGIVLFGLNVIFCLPKDGKHKEISVPLNINFMIHRNSEWIMLNLGESIFSLLIVDLPNSSNTLYSTFYCGLLAVIFLHTLHFRSQPHHAHHHAWRRSKNAGVCFTWLTHAYTLALVSLGASYTVFLVPVEIADETTKAGHRLLSVLSNFYYDNNNDTNNDVNSYIQRRWLATTNGGSDVFNLDDYNHKVAQLFSISLAMIFACLDLMTVAHLGFKECEERCYCKDTKTRNNKGFVIIAFRIGLVVFTATMFLWEVRPNILSLIGLLLVLTQIMLRKLAGVYLRRRRRPKTAPDICKLKKKKKKKAMCCPPSPQDPTQQAVEEDDTNNGHDTTNDNGEHHEK